METCTAGRTVRKPSLWLAGAVVLCALLLPQEAGATPDTLTEVIYPAAETTPTGQDVRNDDLVALLQGALERTVPQSGQYYLHSASLVMNEARQLRSLQQGRLLNVVWSAASRETERQLLPVRIPLRKNLMGYRIALIPKALQGRFDKVKTAEDLRAFVFGTGTGWRDTGILQRNGFRVISADYPTLFQMLPSRRFDVFLRGINEVFREYDEHVVSEPDIAIDNRLLITYPLPYYFWFNRKDAKLAARVEAGLRMMQKDGSFERIFQQYHGRDLQQAELERRHVIALDNPDLPAGVSRSAP